MTIVGVYLAVAKGEPMAAIAAAQVSRGLGIDGDRYRHRTGHWSDPRWPDQQVTLVEAETADDLGLDAGLLRRNLVTRGDRLDDLLGYDIVIGGAVLRFVRPCDPCAYLETLLDRPGLRAALAGRGGVRAEVIRSGTIAVGDTLRISAGADPASRPRAAR